MKNAKGVSHTATVRGQFHNDEAVVLHFTGMTDSDLSDYKMDTGKEWITKYATNDLGLSDKQVEGLWMEPELLQWWNNQWRIMDHFFILPWLHAIDENKRNEVYRQVHEDVFLKTHPNYKAMERSLASVVARMRKTDLENLKQ